MSETVSDEELREHWDAAWPRVEGDILRIHNMPSPWEAFVAGFLAGRVSSAPSREAIADALKASGVSPIAPDGIHSWRCEHPDVYGPCECFDRLLDDLVALTKENQGDKG